MAGSVFHSEHAAGGDDGVEESVGFDGFGQFAGADEDGTLASKRLQICKVFPSSDEHFRLFSRETT